VEHSINHPYQCSIQHLGEKMKNKGRRGIIDRER
jgi:hypothetical protein